MQKNNDKIINIKILNIFIEPLKRKTTKVF
jgi:hypothetical protein